MTPSAVLSLGRVVPGDRSESTAGSKTGDAPEIVITPSPKEYEQLERDLKALRDAGAESNTQAIVDAVREKANVAVRVPTSDRKRDVS